MPRRGIVAAVDLMHWVVPGILLQATLIAGAQVAAPRATSTATISAVAVRGGPIVAIDATGILPVPRVGTLKSPDRLYFDFDGVSSRTLKVRGDDHFVTSVRAALNSVAPRVTRVVVDLSQPCRYSLDMSRRDSGHVEIALTPLGAEGASSSAALPSTRDKGPSRLLPPAPPRASRLTPPPRASRLPPPASGLAPPASGLAPPASRPAPRDPATRRYLAVLQRALSGLGELKDVLHDIDTKTNPTPERIARAQAQLSAFRRNLEAVKPTRAVVQAHDLLRTAAGFASTALSLTAAAADEVPPNASSAAAGALLMLDRAEAELAGPDGGPRQSL